MCCAGFGQCQASSAALWASEMVSPRAQELRLCVQPQRLAQNSILYNSSTQQLTWFFAQCAVPVSANARLHLWSSVYTKKIKHYIKVITVYRIASRKYWQSLNFMVWLRKALPLNISGFKFSGLWPLLCVCTNICQISSQIYNSSLNFCMAIQ